MSAPHSAPDVNVERQKRRHHPLVEGICLGLVIDVIVAFFFRSGDETVTAALFSGSLT